MSWTKKPVIRKFRYALLNKAAQVTLLFAGMIPRKPGLFLFGMLGKLAFCFPHADKIRTLTHLTLVYGKELGKKQLRSKGSDVYTQLGKNIFDMIRLPRLDNDRFNRIVTFDPLDTFKSEWLKGKGIIAITAHIGCFQLLLHFMAKHGFPSFAIGRKFRDDALDKTIRSTRNGSNIDYIDHTESPRKMVRWLKEGKVFGVLIDQDTPVEGVFADFLGMPAHTPSGPFTMAAKLDIPVFLITTARQKDDTHHVFIEGPIPLQNSGDMQKRLDLDVALVNSMITRQIHRFPSQWVWMHCRWRNKPGCVKKPFTSRVTCSCIEP